MKRTVSLLLVLVLLLIPFLSFAENDDIPPDIIAEGAILIDADNSQILYEKNAHKKLYPASTTKIMTAILALEHGNLEEIVTVDQEIVDLTHGSHIALEPGEQATLEELLYVMLIGSANDAALAIAKHISGDINSFVNLMNSKAKELGTINTNFINPNGLHNDDHISTAYDLAIIAQYAMKNKVFKKIVKEYIYILEPTNKKDQARFLKSNNRLLYSTRKIDVDNNTLATKYEGCTGIKTGFTNKAQSCLVSSIEKNDRNLIAVVLKSNGVNVFSDSHKLFNYGFNNFTNTCLGFNNQFIDNFNIKNGIPSQVSGILNKNVNFNTKVGKTDKITNKIVPIENLTAPIKKGDVIGTVQFFINDNLISEKNIVASMDVELDPNSYLHRKILHKWYWLIFLLYFLNKIFKYNTRLNFLKNH